MKYLRRQLIWCAMVSELFPMSIILAEQEIFHFQNFPEDAVWQEKQSVQNWQKEDVHVSSACCPW